MKFDFSKDQYEQWLHQGGIASGKTIEPPVSFEDALGYFEDGPVDDDCPRCHGTGWSPVDILTGHAPASVCSACGGCGMGPY